MSRTFELLQRVQNRVGHRPRFAAGNEANVSLEPEEAAVSFEPESIGAESIDADAPAAKLPSAELQALEKREISKLVSRVFRPGDPAAARLVIVAGIDEHASSAWLTACAGELLSIQGSESVCVTDANVHNSGLHHCFGLPRGIGLSEAVRSNRLARDHCHRLSGKLWLLSAGSANGEDGLLASEGMRRCIAQLRREFGFCLIAGPPIGSSAEAVVLEQMADGVLLVIEAHATRRDSALAAKQMLEAARIPVLGAILNNRTFPLPEWLYRRL